MVLMQKKYYRRGNPQSFSAAFNYVQMEGEYNKTKIPGDRLKIKTKFFFSSFFSVIQV